MSINSDDYYSGPYTANGSTAVFPFTFNAMSDEEVQVILNGTVVDPSLYTVDRDDDGSGSIAFISVPLSGTIYVASNPTFEETTEFDRFGPYFPDFINTPLWRAAARSVYLNGVAKRALVLPFGSTSPSSLPALAPDKLLGLDDAGLWKWYAQSDFQGVPGAAGAPGGNALAVGLFTGLAGTVVALGTTSFRTSGHGGTGRGGAFYMRDDATVNGAYVTANPLTSIRLVDEFGTTHGYRLSPWQTITPQMFGAVGNADLADGTFNGAPTDDSAALNAFLLFCSSQRLPSVPEMSGSFYILSPLVFNSNVVGYSIDATYSTAMKFHCRIRAGAAMDHMLSFVNVQAFRASGMIHFYGGVSGSPFTARNVNNGMFINNCVQSAFDLSIFGENLVYSVVETEYSPSNCDLVNIRHIAGKRVGSGPRNTTDTGFGQVATFSTRVDTGTANTFTQASTITPTSLPPAYTDAPQRPVRVWINGYMYRMTAIDRTAGTISISPWLPQGVTTGNLEYNFGAVWVPRGTDSNIINVDTISSQNSAGGAQLGCLYGGTIGTIHCEAGGIALGVGNDPSATMLGMFVGRLYCEGTRLDYYHALGTPTDLVIASASPFDWTKVQSASGTQNGVLTTNPVEPPTGFFGISINGNSRMPTRIDLSTVSLDPSLAGMDGAVWNGPFASMTFNIVTPLAWPLSFFNKRGPTIHVAPAPSVSASGTPTTVTFNAPAGGWTVNGGASAVYTGFSGPASFRFYIDTVALTINIRCLTGLGAGGKPGIAVQGNADVTITPYTDARVQRFTTALTVNRTITLGTGVKGNTFRIVRPATGAFTLSVGGLFTLAAGEWGEVEHDGTAWFETAKGTL
jgi:hypothetical protein